MAKQTEKAERFVALHKGEGAFVIPNLSDGWPLAQTLGGERLILHVRGMGRPKG